MSAGVRARGALLAFGLALTACAAPARDATPRPPAAAGPPPAAYLLYESARQGDYATVRNLLADDPSLAKHRLDQDATALHGAALSDSPRVAEALLAAGAYVDARGGAQRITPLFLAALQNHPRVAEVLLEHRADPNTKGKASLGEGLVDAQPLHVAALAGGTRLVQVLLSHGAGVSARSGAGSTPAQCAAQGGRFATLQVIEAYRRYGAARARPMGDLLVAIDAGDSAAVLAVLDRDPALAGVRLGDEATPLHVAAEVGSAPVCRALYARGADPAAHERTNDWTPAVRAAAAGHPEVSAEIHAWEAARTRAR